MNKSFVPQLLLLVALFCSFGIIILAGIWLAFIFPRSVVVGNGRIVEEERELSDFRKIIVQDGIKVNVKQRNLASAKVSSEENIIKHIKTNLRGDTLYVEIERSAIFNQRTANPTQEIVVDLEVKTISEIRLINSTLNSTSRIRTDSLSVYANGNSKLELDIFATELNVNISNTTELNIKGAVNIQKIDVTGDATYSAGELESMSTTININGRGKSTVRVSDSLAVYINGIATLTYFGSPERIDQNVSGGGKVIQERE
jgi:hypothetical protein